MLVAEFLSTANYWTREGLGIIVQVHVASQASFRGECFVTALDRATECKHSLGSAPFGIRSLAQDAFGKGRRDWLFFINITNDAFLKVCGCILIEILCVKHDALKFNFSFTHFFN